jgi:predicted molibdopterin-dependent oxidoreductase YjgC
MNYKSVPEIFAEIGALAPIYNGIVYKTLTMGGAHWPAGSKKPGTLYVDNFDTNDGLGHFGPQSTVIDIRSARSTA